MYTDWEEINKIVCLQMTWLSMQKNPKILTKNTPGANG